MRLGNIANKAKQAIDKRGGVDALKEDAAELKNIAKGKGTLKDKAKAAGGALKDPGAKGAGGAGDKPPAAQAPPPSGRPAGGEPGAS